jgi:hypothetical protein
MNEVEAKARLLAAYMRLRDDVWQQARLAPSSSRQIRDIIERSLEELRLSIEADPAWLEQVLKDVGFHQLPRPPGPGGSSEK